MGRGTMGTVDFKTERTFDRRIGQRLELDGIDVINVSWVVPQAGRFGRRKPPLELPGRIENVSVTGAAIVGPIELAFSPGDEAVVRCGGRDNVVSIRHCEPAGDERTVRYGVEITSVAPNLKQRIRELLEPTLTRLPVETAGPGLLSLRAVSRPVEPAAPSVEPAEASDREDAGPTVEPEVAAPAAETDDHVVLDLTDATLAAQGAAVVDVTDPAPIQAGDAATSTEPRPAVVAAEPESVIEPEPAGVTEPAVTEPVDTEPAVTEPVDTEPVADDPAPTPSLDAEVPVNHAAHLPAIDMSAGRQVLDEVFGLMED